MANYFVHCDWGTTRFRLRLCRLDTLEVRAGFESAQGVASLASETAGPGRPGRFAGVLQDGLRQLIANAGPAIGAPPVVISGMASSSIGWRELPYAPVPWRLDGSGLIRREFEPIATEAGSHRVILISGTRTATDILRGEETQAVGLFQLPAAQYGLEHSIVILPGTHSKHLRVESGCVENFQTFMTGELFDVIAQHSILQHSIAHEPFGPEELSGERLESFEQGVVESLRGPLSATLFRVRTRQVLDGMSAEANQAFLSGLLLGCELSYLDDDSIGNAPLILCAPPQLARFYTVALDRLGLAERVTAIAAEDVERLSALGQACLLKQMGIA